MDYKDEDPIIDVRTINGHTAVALYLSCPNSRSGKRKCFFKPTFWEWVDCKHLDYGDDQGDLWCVPEKCGFSYFIKDVGFKCNDNKHGNEYIKFSRPDLIAAIADMTYAITGTNAEEEEMLKF